MSHSRRPYLVDELLIRVELPAWDSPEFIISGTLSTAGIEMGDVFWSSLECNMTDLQEGELLGFISETIRSLLTAFRTDVAVGGGGQLSTNDWGSPPAS